ncbi:MAG: lamin tail domain-containing protein, partial [Bacteroidota bacterium]
MRRRNLHQAKLGLSLILLIFCQRINAQNCPPGTPPVVINEIHYNPPNAQDPGDWLELYNPTGITIDLSAYQLKDNGGTYTIPNGTMLAPDAYLVLARNTLAFAAVYPGVTNVIGPIPFGFSGSGETLRLLTDAACVLDSVRYDDQFPWPASADGNGPSIELINPNLDNALAASWVASPVYNGTPGSPNAGAFDPCDPTPPSLIITEINYNAPPPIDAGDWVEIYNPNSSTVDLSAWRLSDGGGLFSLPLGFSIAPNSYLVIVQDSAAFQAQHPSVSNFVGNFPFGLSANGDQLILSNATGCAVDGVVYEDGGDWPNIPDGNGPTLALTNIFLDNDLATSWGTEWNVGGSPGATNTIRPDPCWPVPAPNLLISEVNYQSDTINANAGDWVEIHNPLSTSVDISLYQLRDESGSGFFIPSGTILPAGGYFVLVEDSALFRAQYPSVNNFAGPLGYKLSNSGQKLRLFTPNYCKADEFTYNDLPPWPLAPNGLGYTLSLSNGVQTNDSLSDWAASANIGGTPGGPNLLAPDCVGSPPGLVINEINYNSHSSFDQGDWVEIYNPTANPVDLSGWVFMDETNGFVIPAGITLGPDQYWVLVEDSVLFSTQHPTVSNFVGPLGFTLKGSGEHIFLLDPAFCEADQVEYEASAPWPRGPAGNGPSLSLLDASLDNSLPGAWQPSAANGGTPGQPNIGEDPCAIAFPAIVINEIHYNSEPSFDPSNWIELYNPTAAAVDISGWELHTDSAFYVFPNNSTIAADGYLMLAENTFLFSFQFPGASPYLGPMGFGLDNAGERLLLYSKTYCLIDSVKFNDKSPWPVLGDGKGPSISLRSADLDNALGDNWVASPGNGTPGKANLPEPCVPGRIEEGLVLWLKADAGTGALIAGDPVQNWVDQSAAAHDFVQLSSGAQPLYVPDAPGFNGNPALYFDDENDGMLSSLEISNPYTLFVVYNLETFPQGPATAVDAGSNWYLGPYNQKHSFSAGTLVGDGDNIQTGDTRPVVAVAANTGFFSQFYLNGVSNTEGFATGAPGLINLGASGSQEAPLGGYIAEVIAYDRALNVGERRDVETYLSTKYGITINTEQHRFVHDADFSNNLIGIGRDSLQCFLQTSSKSFERDPILRLSIAEDSLAEEAFVYLSHSGSGMGEDTDPNNLPAGILARNRRIWQVASYDNTRSVQLSFDLSGLGYSLSNLNEFVLLVDGGTNFQNSKILARDYYIEGENVIFPHVWLEDGDHISLARREVISLDLRVWLDGPYESASQLMRDDLRVLDLIPRTEPYDAMTGYERVGDGGEGILRQEVLAQSGSTAIVDWIWIELRDQIDTSLVHSARPALLRRDGKVVDMDGESPLAFPDLMPDQYFVLVRHRNHLGAMAALPLNLTVNAVFADFSSLPMYGDNAQRVLGNGHKGLWMGDANSDGQVIFQGGFSDVSAIFIKVLTASQNATFARDYVLNAYDPADLNMDGQVIFQGSNADVTQLYLRILSYPDNTT